MRQQRSKIPPRAWIRSPMRRVAASSKEEQRATRRTALGRCSARRAHYSVRKAEQIRRKLADDRQRLADDLGQLEKGLQDLRRANWPPCEQTRRRHPQSCARMPSAICNSPISARASSEARIGCAAGLIQTPAGRSRKLHAACSALRKRCVTPSRPWASGSAGSTTRGRFCSANRGSKPLALNRVERPAQSDVVRFRATSKDANKAKDRARRFARPRWTRSRTRPRRPIWSARRSRIGKARARESVMAATVETTPILEEAEVPTGGGGTELSAEALTRETTRRPVDLPYSPIILPSRRSAPTTTACAT